MMNQREAVYAAVTTIVGEISGAVSLTKDQKEQVHALVAQSFINGEVELKGDRTPEYIKKYVPGLVNNWLRKDTRLNGGAKYQAKNPGSRTGSGDEMLKAMKALLAATTDTTAREQIQSEIDKRIVELKPKTEIDVNALPAHLRHLVPTTNA